MFFSYEDVLPSSRAEPASGIRLRQSQLVGDLDFLKRAIPQKLMVTDPAAVRIQSNPRTGEGCKCPARFSNFSCRLQVETVKGQFFCAKQSPHFQSEKRGDGGATERHQKWDERVKAANSQETSKKHECADDFFRPCHGVSPLDCVGFGNQDGWFPETEIQSVVW